MTTGLFKDDSVCTVLDQSSCMSFNEFNIELGFHVVMFFPSLTRYTVMNIDRLFEIGEFKFQNNLGLSFKSDNSTVTA
jgi:hypothetical protein